MPSTNGRYGLGMTVDMPMSLAEELERSARMRVEAGIVTTTAEPAETEEATLERWARVAGR
jgi:hypothetical protein